MMKIDQLLEQQIAIPEEEFILSRISMPTESWIRLKYNIPYHQLPYCYSSVHIAEKGSPFAGDYLFLFRNQPLKDFRKRAWSPSPSTKENLERRL